MSRILIVGASGASLAEATRHEIEKTHGVELVLADEEPLAVVVIEAMPPAPPEIPLKPLLRGKPGFVEQHRQHPRSAGYSVKGSYRTRPK